MLFDFPFWDSRLIYLYTGNIERKLVNIVAIYCLFKGDQRRDKVTLMYNFLPKVQFNVHFSLSECILQSKTFSQFFVKKKKKNTTIKI